MTDNANNPTPSEQPALRLAGAGPTDAVVSPGRGGAATQVLTLASESDAVAAPVSGTPGTAEEAIRFQAGPAANTRMAQPHIRSRLVAARIPGAAIYRL